MKITTLIRVEDAGKGPRSEDSKEIDTKDRKGEKLKSQVSLFCKSWSIPIPIL